MAGLIGWFASKMGSARQAPPFQRDPAFLRKWSPALDTAVRWFQPQVEGEQNVTRPEPPLLLVANHSGGMWSPEAYVLVAWWLRRFGASRPLYLLAHDFLFAIPLFNRALRRAGGIPASMGNARRALRDGATVLVFPGGDQEAFRPWWQRNRIDFAGRRGFVRLALQSGARVAPVVCHGSHDTTIVLSSGRRLAAKMRLDRLRAGIMPFVFGLPWGLVPGFVPTLPLPAQITIRMLPPLDWRSLGAEAVEDKSVVTRCYEQTVSVMQQALSAMARERPWPWVDRWRRLGSAGGLLSQK